MPSRIQALPHDLILYIFSYLDLKSTLALAVVCRQFRHMSCTVKGLWISALRQAKAERPIACLFNEDFTKHDIVSLKQIVYKTLKVDHDWYLPQPHFRNPMKVVWLGPQGRSFDTIFQVPGTDYYVFHHRHTGELECWDISLGKAVTERVGIGCHLLDISPGEDLPGQFNMAILSSFSPARSTVQQATLPFNLQIVSLRYSAEGVNLAVPLDIPLERGMTYWGVFMTAEYVGLLRYADRDDDVPETDIIQVVAYNRETQYECIISTDLSADVQSEGGSGTSTFADNLYILCARARESAVACIPRQHLPTNNNPRCKKKITFSCAARQSVLPIRGWWSNLERLAVLSGDPFYGIPSVSISGVDNQLVVEFWGPAPQIGDANFSSRRASGIAAGVEPPTLIPRHTVRFPGSLHDFGGGNAAWQLMLVPHSGLKVLLVVREGRNGFDLTGSRLVLRGVTVDPVKDEVMEQTLVLPPFLDLNKISNLLLDDHRGIVTLMDSDGFLYVIPYV